MNALLKRNDSEVSHVPAALEDRLQWLRQFGQPRMSFIQDGWHAHIKMNTNTTGCEFEVKSEFSMASPSDAVSQLIDRMLKALAAVGGKA